MSSYDFYNGYCKCDPTPYYLPMLTVDGQFALSFPAMVYNVNGIAIGLAENKAQYISIWNSDPSNQAYGVLEGAPGPTGFMMRGKADDSCTFLADALGNYIADASNGFIAEACSNPFALGVIGDACFVIADAEGFVLSDQNDYLVASLCVAQPIVVPPTGGNFKKGAGNFKGGAGNFK